MVRNVEILFCSIYANQNFYTVMGRGTAWGGRLPCKEENQIGSIPMRSTISFLYVYE